MNKPESLIEIEGRKFKPIKNSTFEHDIWIMNKVRAAGISDVTQQREETQDALIERLATIAVGSGLLMDILGGTLMPAEIDPARWTPQTGEETAAFFGKVTDELSKQKLRSQIGGLLFFFFVNALSASATSQKYGEVTTTMNNQADERQGTEG